MNDAQCIVVYEQSGQLEPAAVLAPPRNVSLGGIAFLNDRYMNPDTRCVIYLRRIDAAFFDQFSHGGISLFVGSGY